MSAYSIHAHMRVYPRARSRRATRIAALTTVGSAMLFAVLLGQGGEGAENIRPNRASCGPDSVIAAEAEAAARPACVPSPREIEP